MFSAKRVMFVLSILLTVCIIGVVSFENRAYIAVLGGVSERPVIIIDAGHGGFDGGAVAHDGTVEKDINLEIALVLREFLSAGGFDVMMTRTSDIGTDDAETSKIATRKKSDLRNRVALMKDYPDAVYVSIHLNKFTTSAASGAQVFYTQKVPEAAELGESIQKAISSSLQLENKRVIKKGTSSTYLLNNATIPTVIVECGFLSNVNDLTKLKNEEYQQKMAFVIYCGILDYYTQQ